MCFDRTRTVVLEFTYTVFVPLIIAIGKPIILRDLQINFDILSFNSGSLGLSLDRIAAPDVNKSLVVLERGQNEAQTGNTQREMTRASEEIDALYRRMRGERSGALDRGT